MRDDAYPDGMAWRCGEPDCDYATDDAGPDCPRHGSLQRVKRRVMFGPPPSMSRDIVVEYRGEPAFDEDRA